jgi:hypothetical protein
VNQNILDSAMFVADDSTQGNLFIETANLSEGFFEQLQKHPVPIEEAAVKQIANNSMALDVYVWLSYRLHSLREPKPISWKALHAQFGRGISRMDHFKQHFRETLELALRWCDPWNERIWEEPSDADESAVLISRSKKA